MTASTQARPESIREQRLPPLQPGDRLTRDEFERRYQAMPELKKAELIEGVVYIMPSPVSNADHGAPHFDLIGWLAHYKAFTPGVQGGDNSTLRLDLDNEPQPDAFLRIVPELGGQSRNSPDGKYIEGAPEWIGEVAATSASYDLHDKLHAYRRNGVKEYLVWRVLDEAVDWFVLRAGRYEPLTLSAEGWYKSLVFPGLWLDPAALVRRDLARILEVVRQGVGSPEHAAFIQALKARPPA